MPKLPPARPGRFVEPSTASRTISRAFYSSRPAADRFPRCDVGASQANVLRAHMTHELLRRLHYVDMSRVAHHGHSLGAYLGVATIAAYPNDFRVASHTGGGVRPTAIVIGPASTVTQ